MKVVFLNDSMCGGGAEKAMANIVNELSKRVKIHLISLENSFCINLDSKISTSYFNEKIDFKIKKLFGLVLDAYKLKQFVKKNNQKIVISFQYRSNFINVIAKLLGSKHKAIVSERNYPKKSLEYLPFFHFLLKKLYLKADLITCNASDTKKLFIDEYNFKKVKLIFNGYDKEKIIELSKKPIEEKYKHIFQNDVLINVGRLTNQKGQEYLLKAFAKLESKYHLLIIGEGDSKSFLKNIAKELNIKDRVFFIGYQSNPYKFIKKSRVFIFTSLYEGFPNALSEAIICRIPVVSFNFKSGANDLIDKEKLVEIGDISALVKNIQNAKKLEDKTLNISEVSDKYYQLIKKALND